MIHISRYYGLLICYSSLNLSKYLLQVEVVIFTTITPTDGVEYVD